MLYLPGGFPTLPTEYESREKAMSLGDGASGGILAEPKADPRTGRRPNSAVSKDDDNDCPECGGPSVRRCRCRLGDSVCENGHEWHYCPGCRDVVTGESYHDGSGENRCEECAGQTREKAKGETVADVLANPGNDDPAGLRVFRNDDGPVYWIDQQDWHDGKLGKRVIAAAKRELGVEVQEGYSTTLREQGAPLGDPAIYVFNEGPNPTRLPGGDGWQELTGNIREKGCKEYDYCSTQIDIPTVVAQQVQELAAVIRPDDLDGKGVERESHVTVRYGLTCGVGQVQAVADHFPPVEYQIGGFDVFERPGKPDVLYLAVTSRDLIRLNRLLCDLPGKESDYDEYHPHCTVAYLKPGTGAVYAAAFNGVLSLKAMAVAREFAFTDEGGRLTRVTLGGTPAEHQTIAKVSGRPHEEVREKSHAHDNEDHGRDDESDDDHPFMHEIAGHAVELLNGHQRHREKAAGAPRQPKAPKMPGGASPPPPAAPSPPTSQPAAPPPASSNLDHLVGAMTNRPRVGKAMAGYVNLHPDEAARLAVSPPPAATASPPAPLAPPPAQRPNSAVSPPPPPPPASPPPSYKPLQSVTIDRTNHALDDHFASPPPPPAPLPNDANARQNPDLDSMFGMAPPRPFAPPQPDPTSTRRPRRKRGLAANPASPPAPTSAPQQSPDSAPHHATSFRNSTSEPWESVVGDPNIANRIHSHPDQFAQGGSGIRGYGGPNFDKLNQHLQSMGGQGIHDAAVATGAKATTDGHVQITPAMIDHMNRTRTGTAKLSPQVAGGWVKFMRPPGAKATGQDGGHHDGHDRNGITHVYPPGTTPAGVSDPQATGTHPPSTSPQQPAEKPHERAAREHYEAVQAWQRKNLGGAKNSGQGGNVSQPAPTPQSAGWPTPRPAPSQPPAQQPPTQHDPDATREMPTPSGTTPPSTMPQQSSSGWPTPRPPAQQPPAQQPPSQQQQTPAQSHQQKLEADHAKFQEWQRQNMGGADRIARDRASGRLPPVPTPPPPGQHDPDATREMPTPSGTTPPSGSRPIPVAPTQPANRPPAQPGTPPNHDIPTVHPLPRATRVNQPLPVAKSVSRQQQAKPTGFDHVVNAVGDFLGGTDTTRRATGPTAGQRVGVAAKAVGERVRGAVSNVGKRVAGAVTRTADRARNAMDPTRNRTAKVQNPWADEAQQQHPVPTQMAKRALPVAKRVAEAATTPAHKDVLANAAKWADRVGAHHADKVAHLFGGDRQRAAKALSRVIRHLAHIAHSNGSGSEAFQNYGGQRFTVRKKAFDPDDLFTPYEPQPDVPTVEVRHDRTAEFGHSPAATPPDTDACPECGGSDAAPFRSPVYALVCSHCGAKFDLSRYGRKKGYPDALPVGFHAVTDHAGRFIRLAAISSREKGLDGQQQQQPPILSEGDWADSDDDGEPTVPGDDGGPWQWPPDPWAGQRREKAAQHAPHNENIGGRDYHGGQFVPKGGDGGQSPGKAEAGAKPAKPGAERFTDSADHPPYQGTGEAWDTPTWVPAGKTPTGNLRWMHGEEGHIRTGARPREDGADQKRQAHAKRQERLQKKPTAAVSQQDDNPEETTKRVQAAYGDRGMSGVVSTLRPPMGTQMTVFSAPWQLHVNLYHPDVDNWSRTAHFHPEGTFSVSNNLFFLKPGARGGGMGTKAFAAQVQGMVYEGGTAISTNAGKGGAGGDKMNGYYTWARLGYDAPLDADVRRKLPEHLRGAKSVQDLMATPEGAAAWKQHGKMTVMHFNTTPGSRSLTVLNTYLKSKGLDEIEHGERAKSIRNREIAERKERFSASSLATEAKQTA